MLRFSIPIIAGLFWLPAAQAAGCETPWTAEMLTQKLDDAESAWRQFDEVVFPERSKEIVDNLRCVSEPLPSETIARLHRQMGLYEVFQRTPEQAEQAFAAARSIQNYYVFPEDFVPLGHPVRSAYDALSTDLPGSVKINSPKEGSIRVNGDITLLRPTAWPVVFQRFDATGKVVETAYLWPEDPTPIYPSARTTSAQSTTTQKSGGSTALTAGAAGLLGVGVTLATSGWLDSSSALCDDSAAGFSAVQADWCNQSARMRVGLGYALIGAGATALGASVILLDGGAAWTLTGRF